MEKALKTTGTVQVTVAFVTVSGWEDSSRVG